MGAGIQGGSGGEGGGNLGDGGYRDGPPPEMVPERSSLLPSPTHDGLYGTMGGSGTRDDVSGGGGFGDAISGKIKSWLEGGGGGGEESPRAGAGGRGGGFGGGVRHSVAFRLEILCALCGGHILPCLRRLTHRRFEPIARHLQRSGCVNM